MIHLSRGGELTFSNPVNEWKEKEGDRERERERERERGREKKERPSLLSNSCFLLLSEYSFRE